MEGFKKGAQTGGLVSHGETMGFKHGGQVKSSPQCLQKTGAMQQKTTGELRGKPTNEDDAALGGKSTLKPGYKHGGYVKCSHGGKMAYKKGGKYYMMKGGKMHPYPTKT